MVNNPPPQIRVQSGVEAVQEAGGWGSGGRWCGRDQESERDGGVVRLATTRAQVYLKLLLWICDEEGVSCGGSLHVAGFPPLLGLFFGGCPNRKLLDFPGCDKNNATVTVRNGFPVNFFVPLWPESQTRLRRRDWSWASGPWTTGMVLRRLNVLEMNLWLKRGLKAKSIGYLKLRQSHKTRLALTSSFLTQPF